MILAHYRVLSKKIVKKVTFDSPVAGRHDVGMIRLGLCCIFREAPIRFRTTTATAAQRLPRPEALRKLAALCRENASSLLQAIQFCAANGIGAFRVNSQILPLKTHPQAGYDMDELPGGADLVHAFRQCGALARQTGIRLLFHPDQFILLSSEKPELTAASVRELEYQADVSDWIGADVINIHGGGAYGNKATALARVQQNILALPAPVKQRLTLENDDRTYTPADLLPICHATGIPLIYDVHHHRCLPDGMSIEAATCAAIKTWNREPVVHLSSPRNGWQSPDRQRHHDLIQFRDFPTCWRKPDLTLTVEVEAKAKEIAVLRLRRALARHKIPVFSPAPDLAKGRETSAHP